MKIIGISPTRRHFLRNAAAAAPAVVLLVGGATGIASAVSSAQDAFKPT
ncbi:hypothetical protein [Glaciimonas immobilis]|uniref:Twin-arginine translocation signal domain-containing protein n=1 Tax=Glaciimonas immobilis TaxID=728004 RepID=A0A840RMU4_9BURK|nr:hypothetical protein [Glaciimonas immobilis]KAF3996824.1 hypothetical protein HAV38_16695 [Glaciimonas immobilis]MBB5199627.1 hypothetical protein [Glaciimonas immobilis]